MPLAATGNSKPLAYAYLNHKLEDLITSLQNARFLLNNAVNKINDSVIQMPLNLLADESLHCEHDLQTLMHVSVDDVATKPTEYPHHYFPPERYNSLSSVALYCEHVYVEKYMQLLNDCHITASVKELLQHHAEALKLALLNMNSLVSRRQDEL